MLVILIVLTFITWNEVFKCVPAPALTPLRSTPNSFFLTFSALTIFLSAVFFAASHAHEVLFFFCKWSRDFAARPTRFSNFLYHATRSFPISIRGSSVRYLRKAQIEFSPNDPRATPKFRTPGADPTLRICRYLFLHTFSLPSPATAYEDYELSGLIALKSWLVVFFYPSFFSIKVSRLFFQLFTCFNTLYRLARVLQVTPFFFFFLLG